MNKIPAKITSIWDDGAYSITTNCKIDPSSRKISDVEKIQANYITNFDYAFVTLNDKQYPVKENIDKELFY